MERNDDDDGDCEGKFIAQWREIRFLNGNFFKLTFFEFKRVLSSKIEGVAKIKTFSIKTTVWTDKKLKTLLNTIENYNFRIQN